MHDAVRRDDAPADGVNIANALVALASPLTYWMTGNVLGVDGGELMGRKDPNE